MAAWVPVEDSVKAKAKDNAEVALKRDENVRSCESEVAELLDRVQQLENDVSQKAEMIRRLRLVQTYRSKVSFVISSRMQP